MCTKVIRLLSLSAAMLLSRVSADGTAVAPIVEQAASEEAVPSVWSTPIATDEHADTHLLYAALVPAELPAIPSWSERLLDSALGLIGIRYRRGQHSPTEGFDCSGYVRYVFQRSLGVLLPRSVAEISRVGAPVRRQDLQPGDLVFFNTMRRAFSHVGIYLGYGTFIHAPRPGRHVQVVSMEESYWRHKFNGARRLTVDR